MKNITHIISRLRQNQLKHLSTLDIINKLILTLPKSVRENVIYASVKGETMLLAVRHISICAEINNFRATDLLNAINLILDSANRAKNAESSLDSAKQNLDSVNSQNLAQNLERLRQIRQIRAFVPKDILSLQRQDLAEEVKIFYYKECATGDFKVDENSPFKEIFENIKLAIKRNIANELKRKN